MCCRAQTSPSRRSSLYRVPTVVRGSALSSCPIFGAITLPRLMGTAKLAEAVRRVAPLAAPRARPGDAHANERSCWDDILAPANRCGTDAGLLGLPSRSQPLRVGELRRRPTIARRLSSRGIRRAVVDQPFFGSAASIHAQVHSAMITGSSRAGRETARSALSSPSSVKTTGRAQPGPRSGISRAIIPSQPSRTTSKRADLRADPTARARACSHRCDRYRLPSAHL
jgi:hypothetical protein